MVIFGAFEMYPPGRSMSLSGTVFVHFLQCVQGKALDRVALSNRVRHDMLEAILKCPENICRRLTVWERILQATLLMITYTLNAVGCYLLWRRFFSTRGTFDVLSALLWFLLISVIITAVLYYYVAYIRNKVRKHDVQSKSKMS
jgi:hypothetical protein